MGEWEKLFGIDGVSIIEIARTFDFLIERGSTTYEGSMAI
jgi:hypothetical protein